MCVLEQASLKQGSSQNQRLLQLDAEFFSHEAAYQSPYNSICALDLSCLQWAGTANTGTTHLLVCVKLPVKAWPKTVALSTCFVGNGRCCS